MNGIEVTPEDKQFLEDNRYHYDMAVNAQMVRHLDGNTRSKMQEIIGKYWIKGYTADLWCPTCAMDMLKLCYQLYDNWKSKLN